MNRQPHSAKAPAKGLAKGLAARLSAVAALTDILQNGANLDTALAGVLNNIDNAQDRNLVRAITTTTLRRKGQIDHALGQFLAKPLPAKSGIAGIILAAAAAQLLFMRIPPHAAIDLAVHQARQDQNARHFSGLINAVLRKVSGAEQDLAANQDAARLNTPDWLWQRWSKAYGDATARNIAEAHQTEAPLDVTVKVSAEAEHWTTALGGDLLPTGSIRITDPSGRIEQMPGYDDGAWWIQDAAAALPVRLLGNVAGLRVLDLCAAPGGKTAQLAAAGASVTALDNTENRLERLQQNLTRLSLAAELVCADATRFQPSSLFDAVIVDAPCSATGTIRRHPDLPYVKKADNFAPILRIQAAILRNAVSLVRPGGQIIYCICSLEPDEGEQQIEALLGQSLPVSRHALTKDDVCGQDHLITPQGDLRTLPCHSIGSAAGMDGFYACRLLKS